MKAGLPWAALAWTAVGLAPAAAWGQDDRAEGPAERTAGAPERAGERVERLCDWERPEDLKAWDFTAGEARLVAEGATHGRRALEIRFDPRGQYRPAYMYWRRVRRNWSAFDALVLDVHNPSDEPMAGYVLIADRAWADKGKTYWNRHNGGRVFGPGRTRWVIPVGGLYRGEAGSRNNDIRRNIDADQIVRVDFGFGRKGATGRVVIDNLRLVKVARPVGLWALDFGPPDQQVMLGWTGVSHATAYTKARGFGWGPKRGHPWDGAARDTTFGPPLLRDFCASRGYRFRVDVPPGRYRAVLIYENAGYWGGEQARHRVRRVRVGGRTVHEERRPDGAAHALHRFEEVEPVGVDLWDTYMAAELALDGLAVRGEAEALCLAIRPLKDLGEVRVAFAATKDANLPRTIDAWMYILRHRHGPVPQGQSLKISRPVIGEFTLIDWPPFGAVYPAPRP